MAMGTGFLERQNERPWLPSPLTPHPRGHPSTPTPNQISYQSAGEDATYDVFVSYAHHDKPAVAPIVEALRRDGLEVWFDETHIDDFESITQSIRNGLQQSKSFLCYYSRIYAPRRTCQWELTTALIAAGGHAESDAPKRMMVINPENDPEHIQPASLRGTRYRGRPTDDASLRALVDSIVSKTNEIQSSFGKTSPLTTWYGSATRAAERFVGRARDMWELHSLLHGVEDEIITMQHGPASVQVRGMGGVGKSLMVEQYALRFAAAYPGGVFWLRAGNGRRNSISHDDEEMESRLKDQLRNIATALGADFTDTSVPDIRAALRQQLARAGKTCLWVVDDMPQGITRESFDQWVGPHPLAKTAITTESREYDGWGTAIDLGSLSEEECLELLESHRSLQDPAEAEAARSLVQKLGFHPLAIDIAGGALAVSTLLTFESFVESLENPESDALNLAADLGPELPTGHEKNIAAAIQETISILPPEGRDFLRLASLIATAPIPDQLVVGTFAAADRAPPGAALAKALKSMDQAYRLSLAERTEGEAATHQVHAMIRRAMLIKDSDQDRREHLASAAVTALTDKLVPVRKPKARSTLAPYVIHAKELLTIAEPDETATLLERVGRYDDNGGFYKSAETYYRKRCAVLRETGADSLELFRARRDHASALHSGRAGNAALELQHEIVRDAESAFGSEHEFTLRAIQAWAYMINDSGDHWEARRFLEQLLPIQQRLYGEDNADTLATKSYLASILFDLGDHSNALKMRQEVFARRQIDFGVEHAATLEIMHNIGNSLRATGQIDASLSMRKRVLDVAPKVYPKNHPFIIVAEGALATTMAAAGQIAEARERHENLVAKCRTLWGLDHNRTVHAEDNLFQLQWNTHKWEWAVEFARDLLAARRAALGLEHELSLTAFDNYLGVLKALFRTDDIVELARAETTRLRSAADGCLGMSVDAVGSLAGLLARSDAVDGLALLESARSALPDDDAGLAKIEDWMQRTRSMSGK